MESGQFATAKTVVDGTSQSRCGSKLSTINCHLSPVSSHLTITFLTDPSFILTMFRPFAGEVSWRPS